MQARINSTRLPGKVLYPFADGSTILGRLVQGLSQIDLPVIVATSVAPADQEIVNWCARHHVQCRRGAEYDVLERFIQVAREEKLDAMVRVCADNPFFQFDTVHTLLQEADANPELDYVSFRSLDGTPAIRMHWGLFGEYVKVSSLQKSYQSTNELLYREHVTNYIYSHPTSFYIRLLDAPAEVINRKDLRFTVDDMDDFRNMDELLSVVGDTALLQDLVQAADTQLHIKNAMQQTIDKYSK